MAQIQVQKGYRFEIILSVDAAARQRFKVYGRVGNNPQTILLDVVPGGGKVNY